MHNSNTEMESNQSDNAPEEYEEYLELERELRGE